MTGLLLALALCTPGQTPCSGGSCPTVWYDPSPVGYAWHSVTISGMPASVYGFVRADGLIQYDPTRVVTAKQPAPQSRKENAGQVLDMYPKKKASPPPAPPASAPAKADAGEGELSGNDPETPDSSLPAYALNGVIETPTTERVIYTNVPSLAPKLAREYGVRVETSGDVPDSYPESDGTRMFIAPVLALAATVLVLWRRK